MSHNLPQVHRDASRCASVLTHVFLRASNVLTHSKASALRTQANVYGRKMRACHSVRVTARTHTHTNARRTRREGIDPAFLLESAYSTTADEHWPLYNFFLFWNTQRSFTPSVDTESYFYVLGNRDMMSMLFCSVHRTGLYIPLFRITI